MPEYMLPRDAEDIRCHYLEEPDIIRPVHAIYPANIPKEGKVSMLVRYLEHSV